MTLIGAKLNIFLRLDVTIFPGKKKVCVCGGSCILKSSPKRGHPGNTFSYCYFASTRCQYWVMFPESESLVIRKVKYILF